MIELHDRETAPEGSKPVLEAVHRNNGFTPNLFRALANSPSTLNGFVALLQANDAGTLSPLERQIVQMVASIENGAGYCVAGHSTFAERTGLPSDPLVALRDGRQPEDARHRVLARFTRAIVRGRGQVSEHDKASFLASGYAPEQIIEVIACVALKTVTNYTSNVFDLPLDPEFQPHAWVQATAPVEATVALAG